MKNQILITPLFDETHEHVNIMHGIGYGDNSERLAMFVTFAKHRAVGWPANSPPAYIIFTARSFTDRCFKFDGRLSRFTKQLSRPLPTNYGEVTRNVSYFIENSFVTVHVFWLNMRRVFIVVFFSCTQRKEYMKSS